MGEPELEAAVRKVIEEMEDGAEGEQCQAADAETVTFWRNHLRAYLPIERSRRG